jgi:hypothetical protein
MMNECTCDDKAPLLSALEHAAVAWARADRVADDRTADVQGIERVIAASKRPVPKELLAARQSAQDALSEACKAEGAAEHELREAATRLLDAQSSSRGEI